MSKRTRYPPARLLHSIQDKEEVLAASMKGKKICVRCNQTGKIHKVQLTSLSREDGEPVLATDLREGKELLLDYNKKSYQVTLLSVSGKNEDLVRGGESSSSKKIKLAETNELPTKKYETSHVDQEMTNEELMKVVSDARKSLITPEMEEDFNSSDSEDCIIQPVTQTVPVNYSNNDIMHVLWNVESMLESLVQHQQPPRPVKEEEDPQFVVNGINLLQIPSPNANGYGRSLLDVLFTKEEQAKSVVVPTKKSLKPPLSPPRVQLMFDCINRRYKEYSHKSLMATLGQKCRDASRKNNSKN